MAKVSTIKELVIKFSLNKRDLLIWGIYIAQLTKFPSIVDLDAFVKISISPGDFSFFLISWLKVLSGSLLSLAFHPG